MLNDIVYLIFFLSVAIQFALILHVSYSHRNIHWIWVITFFPIVGSLVYLIFVIKSKLPLNRVDTASGSSIARALDEVIKLVDSTETAHYYHELEAKYRQSRESIRASIAVANDKDANLMYMLAITEFALLNFNSTKSILDELIAAQPEFRNAEAHLLYAKTLEKLGDYNAAIAEYESLDSYYHDPDATYYLALLLKEQGETEKAKKHLKKIISYPPLPGKYHNSTMDEFKKKASKTLAEMR